MTKLTFLSFRENQLTGTLPTEMGLLTAVNDAYFYSNNLIGTIPTEMGLMTSLEEA
eukprot:CAMPEP_0202463672 /NCGR_PEP_ID=MMETSP1360-20130828/59112_1 /ASSEMBLY_ACC=CAM_ASM_000848 /TAXON_ID=515479 /ORGANISM="Licmophora paradoxa, Strain CCMP2313" /LENGTH=55 /DNA_ID=CAMNT_0049086669 /DNA_START=11 /DNA_END=174 /DNA_ORIENTATION=+